MSEMIGMRLELHVWYTRAFGSIYGGFNAKVISMVINVH